jgi:quercetin dioxygenase-like cupin family protein
MKAVWMAAGIALGAGGLALAQATVLQPTRAPQGQVLASVDLGAEFPAMKGYVLDLDRATLVQGAGRGFHAHDSEPEIVQVVQGVLSDQRQGAAITDHGPGTTIVNANGTVHAVVNRGPETVVFYVAAIRKAPPAR